MANSEHLAKLKEGVKEFNDWRVQIGDMDLCGRPRRALCRKPSSVNPRSCGSLVRSCRRIMILSSSDSCRYFIAMPCGRAGPVENAVLKSSSNRGSSSRPSFFTLATWILWSPSACTLPKLSSLRK